MWQITARVDYVETGGESMAHWNGTRHLPIFYLDENIQGIVSEEHAKRVALDVIDPMHTLRATCAIRIDVYKMPESEQNSPKPVGEGKYVLSWTYGSSGSYVCRYPTRDLAARCWENLGNSGSGITNLTLTVKED